MDFTQQHLDTINELAASYFRNGEAKTVEDVNRVLDLVTKSRSQNRNFRQQIEALETEFDEKNKKFEPKVPWPEPSHPKYPNGGPYGGNSNDWGNSKTPLCAGGGAGTIVT